MRKTIRISVRDVDKELWRRARKDAFNSDKSTGQWLNEAIKEKLERASSQS